MQFISIKYKQFKEKNRNKYYYYRSHVEVVVRFFLINIVKTLVLPFVVILYPLFKFLEYKRIFFVHDIMPGVGHLVPEFDLFKFKHQDKAKVILICSNNKNYDLIISSFRFYKIFRPKLFLIISIILDFYPKTTIRASQTLPNHVMPVNIFIKKYNIKYYFKDYIEYLNYRKNNNSHFKEIFQKQISENKFIDGNKIACLHIRENISHAVPVVTNPRTYLKSIEYLKDNNYKIYFIGRERMPSCFNKYGLINYAESEKASLENDFKLIFASDISIICGSGASYLPDTLDKKYLYLNSYHISRPGGIGKLSITLPSILISKSNNHKLSFIDQLNLENSGTHLQSSFLDLKKFELIHACENQILKSLIELENLSQNDPLTKEQEFFNNHFKKFGWLSATKARVSQSFLIKNRNILF